MQEQEPEEQPMIPGTATTTYANTVNDVELSKFYLKSQLGSIYKSLSGLQHVKGKGLMLTDDPMMTIQAANKIVNQIMGIYTDLNFRMNRFDEEEIKNKTRVFNRKFSAWFINNYENFEVREDEVLIIISMITDYVQACLQKSLDGGERGFHKGTVQTKEVVTNNPQNKSFWSVFGK